MAMSDKRKINELKDMIAAVLAAIPQELRAYHYYTELAEKSKSESSKKMFEYLAMQEKLHENKLKLILKKLHRELESELHKKEEQ